MANVKCPSCGRDIRYVAAAPSLQADGIVAIEIQEQELITEKGRLVRGFHRHKCPQRNADGRYSILADELKYLAPKIQDKTDREKFYAIIGRILEL
jgi:hypothetical protein